MSDTYKLQESKKREKVYVPSKDAQYYKEHTEQGKTKGIKALLQRLIPGGETGMEAVPKKEFIETDKGLSFLSTPMTADEVDEYNLKLAKEKANTIFGTEMYPTNPFGEKDYGGGVREDRSYKVAEKISDILDREGQSAGTHYSSKDLGDEPTKADIRTIVEMIAQNKIDAQKDVDFLNTDHEGRMVDPETGKPLENVPENYNQYLEPGVKHLDRTNLLAHTLGGNYPNQRYKAEDFMGSEARVRRLLEAIRMINEGSDPPPWTKDARLLEKTKSDYIKRKFNLAPVKEYK